MRDEEDAMRPVLPPPGDTEAIAASRALVLAPHYDDEVLGCGGLVARLADRGAEVRVLFATDGSGGVEEVVDRERYAARRREEAASAAEALGVAGADHLGLPDGALEQHREELAAAIGRALLDRRPELLLAPSPLEATADHRAAFAALHDLLSPLRPGDPLHQAVAELDVLLYEVNHPGYPNLLVDVTAEIPRLERAMACYASQQERHDYLAAAVGLRRFRALSLPPSVGAAEGYVRLAPIDFATRGLARLTAELGGAPSLLEVAPGARVSVVVRTRDRPELLAEALGSLAASTYRRAEVVVVNDGGGTPELPRDHPLQLRLIELPEGRGRAAAANAGVAAATGEWVTFLDDDDLVEPEHLATLVGVAGAAGVRVAYTDAAVGVYEASPEGWRQVERRLPYSRDFDAELLLVDNYIPFNTLLMERELLLAAGPFDEDLPFFEDWELLVRLARLAPFHHLPRVTCEYRHFRGTGHVFGERPRERPDFLTVKEQVLARHRQHLTPALLARVIDRLRAEAVEQGEEARVARRSRRQLAADLAAREEAWHRLHGEAVGLREERSRLHAELARLGEERDRAVGELGGELARRDRELQRLYEQEQALRGHAAEQDDHIRRLYAELERLQGVIEAMRSTRAWRLHEMVQRRRP
jgi:LmbE family N-acetylglucosaminyl deacetylase/glycosyltransferase involved in cell wall biosynthesis